MRMLVAGTSKVLLDGIRGWNDAMEFNRVLTLLDIFKQDGRCFDEV